MTASALALVRPRTPSPDRAGTWLDELERLDRALYAAVAGTSTPRLDGAMRGLSHAADYSRLSIASAAAVSLLGGERGRSAARLGLASLVATSACVNLLIKPLGHRTRPDRPSQRVPRARQVRMPSSRSFPSGHTACATAFASGVGRILPLASLPLHLLSAVVGYSRVHTGVHYPGDVVAGALIGAITADITADALLRRSQRRPSDVQNGSSPHSCRQALDGNA